MRIGGPRLWSTWFSWLGLWFQSGSEPWACGRRGHRQSLENPSAFSRMSLLPAWKADPWRRDPEAGPAPQPISSAALGLPVCPPPAPFLTGQEGWPGPLMDRCWELPELGPGLWEAAPSSRWLSSPSGQTAGPRLNKQAPRFPWALNKAWD